jgi:hypothetical protein
MKLKATVLRGSITGHTPRARVEIYTLQISLPNDDVILTKSYESIDAANAVASILNDSWDSGVQPTEPIPSPPKKQLIMG